MSADPWIFFYGSFMNTEVLKSGGFTLGAFEVARLWGFDVVATPLVTLKGAADSHVYGIACQSEWLIIERLYGARWPYRAGGPSQYVPTAVLLTSTSESSRVWPALCYIAPADRPVRPDAAYLNRVVEPARAYGFPQWYVERLQRLGGEEGR